MTKQEMEYFKGEFDQQNENFKIVFERLNQHGEDIATLKEKTSFLTKVIWTMPTGVLIVLAVVGLVVKWKG